MSVADTVGCDACGKRFRWKPQLAGRKVRCTCGHVLLMPDTAPVLESDSAMEPAFALAEQAAGAAGGESADEPLGGLLAAAMSPTKSAVVRSLEERADEHTPSRVRNVYVPTALLAVGVLLAYVLWSAAGSLGGAMVVATGNLLLQVAVFLPLGFVAVLVTAQLMGVDFDLPRILALKLAAVVIGVLGALDATYMLMLIHFEFDFQTVAIGLILYTAVCGLATWYLFELDFYEAMLMTFAIIFPRVVMMQFASRAVYEGMLT